MSNVRKLREPAPKPPRRFWVTMVAEFVITDELLEACMKQKEHELGTPEEVVEHLAYNLAQGTAIESLDGFADRKSDECALRDFRVDSVEEDEAES